MLSERLDNPHLFQTLTAIFESVSKISQNQSLLLIHRGVCRRSILESTAKLSFHENKNELL